MKLVNKLLKKQTKGLGHIFKSVGHGISKTVGGVYNDAKHATGGVYNDLKGAVSYGGKHIIKDIDGISNILSSPFLYIGLGVVGIIVFTQMKK